ncbi:unnamed protein product [Diatraea saccharalis]|uniref:Dynein heavy chain C-terminal domain-containing protein n=1 Tax=Diatraea saccharalis TaxID=40085 RepID=A0A9N9QL50_9NEOP|nr:unnamed protein product [Diatraea saccharalis]
MSEALESMASSLARNAVPTMWSSKAYPSLKPLGNLLLIIICMGERFMPARRVYATMGGRWYPEGVLDLWLLLPPGVPHGRLTELRQEEHHSHRHHLLCFRSENWLYVLFYSVLCHERKGTFLRSLVCLTVRC